MSDLTLIKTPKGTPVTAASLAPMQFKAVKEFRGKTKKQRIAFAHERIESLRPALVLAVEALAFNKDELTEKVGADLDTWGPMLMFFAHAREAAQGLVEVFQSAELRVAVAVAIAEGDDEAEGDADA